jgi:glycine dehydrogenase
MHTPQSPLEHPDSFVDRHIGPRASDIQEMLKLLSFRTLDELSTAVVPGLIRSRKPLQLETPLTEADLLKALRAIATKNQIFKSYIGMGYSDCITPAVIQRNILENPGWYTQYTPYQSEIAQGRLEALLNFQTLVIDLTGLEIANASMLDEATAAAEAMFMAWNTHGRENGRVFLVSEHCHPQTIAVLHTRAKPLGIELKVERPEKFEFNGSTFGMIVQYPNTDGSIEDYKGLCDRAHQAGALAVVACDILSLALLTPPGEFGADIAVGNTQRLGVPLGFGGPHAAFFATRDQYKRQLPGRIVGVSRDVDGKPAIRLALQTREQHIRRDKATSNICTAQVLLAVTASMYAVYHGPEGLKKIAERIHWMALILDAGLRHLGLKRGEKSFFDTVRVELSPSVNAAQVVQESIAQRMNFRRLDDRTFTISLDETTSSADVLAILSVFGKVLGKAPPPLDALVKEISDRPGLGSFARKSKFLTHPVFNTHRSETEMLRYMTRLQGKDLSLTTSMIALGSCTMKLNATAEMLPITWPEFGRLHPFVPSEQTLGYQALIGSLEKWLEEITGFNRVSLQPNAGSQGEYAGLMVIHKFHEQQGQSHRNICLIPQSAHGTNPASATMAGMKVVVVACDAGGNVDMTDLKNKAQEHARNLAAFMVTYPSTHGVFEEEITEMCRVIHENGGQVYMDGANMNAQVGLCRPGDFGADVCHLNLHKTFCIPHGGGGPGMGPIGVKAHLAPYLPGHPIIPTGGAQAIGPVSAAPWGSPSILPISWAYIAMMGASGLTRATQVAILNANYIARRLEEHYPVLYKGKNGWVAHECIFDLRPLKTTAGIEVEDVAKRLMDYGFHAPTVSFPVPGTMMVEPTESESREELDRFCEAMISIRGEIREIESGKAERENNVLKNAPHTAEQALKTDWSRPYTREKAVYPLAWVRENKFWPAVGRINNVLGDRNLVCACLPIEAYT